MIIARATREGREVLILGLSHQNLARIMAGQPLHIHKSVHPGVPDGWEIVLISGETEEAMQKMFVDAGCIGPQTSVHVDERLKGP
jgi:hypothetical protein